jgi:hypothetical protein
MVLQREILLKRMRSYGFYASAAVCYDAEQNVAKHERAVRGNYDVVKCR